VLKPAEFDRKRVMDALTVNKPHKTIFHSVNPNVVIPGLASVYAHIQNVLNAGEFSFGFPKGSMATAAVFIGPSVLFALNDAMWAKYNLGAGLNLLDANKQPETSNVYYKAQTSMSFEGEPAAGGNIYQDWSGEACLKRGTTFMVCHNALAGQAGRVSMGMGADPRATLAEWKANMIPGYVIVPAGVAVLQIAMENNWKLVPIL
jgi:hypothetical protein